MALINIYHVVADQLPVNQDFIADIMAGMCVKIDDDGTVTKCDTAGELVYGIAGDTQSNTTAGTAYADNIITGAYGALARSTQNRVSDNFNETGASGLMTVYTSGGKFATDEYDTTREDSLTPGTKLYTNNAGLLSDVAGAGNVVGIVVSAPAAYPSGVPGTDINGSMSLGTYLIFKLIA